MNFKEPPAPNAVALHPAILKRYEQQLLHLESALGKGVSAGDTEATEAIRDLVETVTVFKDPARPGGVAVEITGRLNALIGEEAYPNRVKGVWGKVVAGVRYTAKRTISKALFSYRRAA
jgi:site-specific DNA recombinase